MSGFLEVCNKLERSFVINGKSYSTLINYTRCLSHLALHYGLSPEELNEDQIQDYLFYCKNLHKTPSESFFKHTIYGLRSLYKVLNLPDRRINLPEIKAQNNLPVVLSKSEMLNLLKAPKYLRHRLMLGMLYGCGLRSYELCNLTISDVDFDRKTVFIKKQKGNRDRYVPLNDRLAKGLQEYLSTEHPHYYLFNSQKTKAGVPQGIQTNGIRWVVKEYRSKIGSSKKVTTHTLRHTYATHLLEDGMNILAIKELLGHARIETTLIYLHVANLGSSVKYSPLDTLLR